MPRLLSDACTREAYISFSTGRRWHTGFAKSFRWAVEVAKIAYCTPHDIRRSVATRLKERGASDRIIQAILGHVSLDTTSSNYVELSAEFKKGVMGLLE